MTYQIRDNQIDFDNGKSVALPFTVGEAREVDGVVVAVLKLSPGQSMTENVFGVAEDGVVLWQIERIPETSIDPISNQYAGIGGKGKGRVHVGNWNGMVVEVDVKTGKVTNRYWGK